MSDSISLVRWRDAKTEPPGCDLGRDALIAWKFGVAAGAAAWASPEAEFHGEGWAELPAPPSEDALTLDHLRRVLVLAVQRVEDCESRLNEALVDDHKAIARLRRAIEAAEGHS